MTAPNSVATNCPEQNRRDLIARIAVLLDEMAEMQKTNTKLENYKNMALIELFKVLVDNIDLKACNESLLKKVAEMEANNKSASAPTQSPLPRPSDQPVQENPEHHKTASQLCLQLCVEHAENCSLNVKHEDDRYGDLLSFFKSLRDERGSAICDNVAVEEEVTDPEAAVVAIRKFHEQRECSDPQTDALKSAEAHSRTQASRIDVLERALATANQAIKQKNDSLGVFESKLERTKRRLKDSKGRVKDLRIEVSELEEELSAANSTIEWLTGQAELHEKSARQANRDFKALSSLLSQVQDANEAAQSKVWQQDEQISQFTAASS